MSEKTISAGVPVGAGAPAEVPARWSAARKTDVVLRLLRGDTPDEPLLAAAAAARRRTGRRHPPAAARLPVDHPVRDRVSDRAGGPATTVCRFPAA